MRLKVYFDFVFGISESHGDNHELYGKVKNCIWFGERFH